MEIYIRAYKDENGNYTYGITASHLSTIHKYCIQDGIRLKSPWAVSRVLPSLRYLINKKQPLVDKRKALRIFLDGAAQWASMHGQLI